MPLIPQQIKTERAHLQIRIDVGVLGDLESYCRFIHSSRDFVVENALQFLFRKDHDFQNWLTTNRAAGVIATPPSDTAADAQDTARPSQRNPPTRGKPEIEAQ